MGANSVASDRDRRAHEFAHRLPLLYFATAATVGVVADASLGPALDSATGFSRVLLIWFPCFVLCALLVLIGKSHTRLLAFGFGIIPLSAAWHAVSDARFNEATICSIISEQPEPTVVEMTIDRPITLRRHPLADTPSRRDQSPWQTQLEARVHSVRVGQSYESFTGRVLVVCDGRLDHLLPGDRIEVFGMIRAFPEPTNPGERDLRSVYRRRGLHARVEANRPEQIIQHSGIGKDSIRRRVGSFARFSRDALIRHTSKDNGPLALALVIGQRELVDNETRDLLLVTGTAHLLSVSGLHLAIIVVMARWIGLLFRMPLALQITWIVGVCALYTAITGGRPPVMRASILVATFMVSIWIRRQGQPINTLSLAAIILLALNPENVFSVGVQLSFLAVATLLLCGGRPTSSAPAVEQALQREQRLENLAEGALPWPLRYARWIAVFLGQALWFSGCVTAISIPLVWHQFHVVSLVSVVTNVLLGPLLFISLACGVVTVVAALVYEPLAVLFGTGCDWGLSGMLGVIDFAACVPGGHHWLPAPPTMWVITFYIVLGLSMTVATRRGKTFRRCWIFVWSAIAWWLATSPTPMDDCAIEATFVDVGHGTSVVLRFAEDDVWLYDCGRMGNDTGSSRDIDATLWSMGVTRLRGVFLSHADSDHYNALPGILRRFAVAQIITPPGMLSEPEPNLDQIRLAIRRSAVSTRELFAGMDLKVSGRIIRALHPPAHRIDGSDNANSLVIACRQKDATLILPGDLEPPGTMELVNQDRPPPGSVLMAPHHGSLTMDATTVLQWARPRETVVSGGRRAKRAAVRQMLAASGSGVHITAEVGAIRVRIATDSQIRVRSWAESPW